MAVTRRVFPKHYRMFPCGLDSMYAVHPALQSAPIKYQADWLERNLGFLKELDGQLPDTTHSEPKQPSSSAPIKLPAAVPALLATESVSDHVKVLNQVFESTVPRMPESMTVKGKWRTSGADGSRVTKPQEFWESCWKHCSNYKTVFWLANLVQH